MPATQDIFTSQPAPGAVLRDWTHKTLTVDLDNSLGEKFHFEIKPGEKSDKLPPAPHSDKIALRVKLPIVKA